MLLAGAIHLALLTGTARYEALCKELQQSFGFTQWPSSLSLSVLLRLFRKVPNRAFEVSPRVVELICAARTTKLSLPETNINLEYLQTDQYQERSLRES